jgi:hypothetical protein
MRLAKNKIETFLNIPMIYYNRIQVNSVDKIGFGKFALRYYKKLFAIFSFWVLYLCFVF